MQVTSIDQPQSHKSKPAAYRVTLERLEKALYYWRDASHSLEWDCLFVTPIWLRLWWNEFKSPPLPLLFFVWQGSELLGIAPLVVKDDKATFIGNADVCDYLDFVVNPERAEDFLLVLLEHLGEQGVSLLSLQPVRQDSSALGSLGEVARRRGYVFSFLDEDMSLEMQLPKTWDEFLGRLSGKERHEIKRKLRRLHEAGNVRFRIVEKPDEVTREMGSFLSLFRISRKDKSLFMTSHMASFFQNLAKEMAALQMLKLMFLDIDGNPAASVMCFDYRGSLHLYNNGYDPRYFSLSAGLMSKVLSIQYAIEIGKAKYNFLKGSETYKFRLGGKPVPICRCKIHLR